MKILREVFFAVVLILVPTYVIAANANYMRISLIEGDVQTKTPEAEDWGYASMNSPVGQGDEFWVPLGGRAEIQVNDGTYIRVAQNSSLQILSVDKDSLQFYLSKGNAYIVNNAPQGSVTQIDTSDASTRVFVDAIFRIDLLDKYTDVAVYKEYVETENEAGSTKVNAGEIVSLGLSTNGEVAPMGQPDEWEKWNRSRNDKIFARTGTEGPSNMPEELKTYSSDLDNNGKWVQVPEYGNVWTPTVDAQWVPYRDGRWIWRGDDYVWVASEPWGWAPYHYGRWAFVAGIGWSWVPPVASEVYWSPGYVGWVRTADYVAWVPLAPGEIYYGRGYYGRNSVNITNVNINQVNITNVYKNVSVNNGVTVVRRDTFASAAPKIVHVDQNTIRQKIFVRNNISVGTPAIKPTRASYFASSKMIPASKLPPQSVRNVRVKELKQARPFVRERGKSVLNFGSKPKTLPVNTVTVPRTPGRASSSISLVRPQTGIKDNDRKPQVKTQQNLGRVGEKDQKIVGAAGGRKPQVKTQQNLGRVGEKDQKIVGAAGDRKPQVKTQQNLGKDQRKSINDQETYSHQVSQGKQSGGQQVKQGKQLQKPMPKKQNQKPVPKNQDQKEN